MFLLARIRDACRPMGRASTLDCSRDQLSPLRACGHEMGRSVDGRATLQIEVRLTRSIEGLKWEASSSSARRPVVSVLVPVLVGLVVTLVSSAGMTWCSRHVSTAIAEGADIFAARLEASGARDANLAPSARSADSVEPPKGTAAMGPASQDHPPFMQGQPTKSSEQSAETLGAAHRQIGAPVVQVARLDAARCEGISAYIVSAFEKSELSVATLSMDPKDQGTRRRVGQEFGGYQVIRIDYNPRRMSSAVWLAQGTEVCQVLLRDDHPVRERVQKVAAQKRARAVRAEERKRAALARKKKQLERRRKAARKKTSRKK